jgi:hypothetical protein
MVYLDPPESLAGDLPVAATCQGGAGCAEQPLIPPPAIGLPSFGLPVLRLGPLVRVEPGPGAFLADPPLAPIEHPPSTADA